MAHVVSRIGAIALATFVAAPAVAQMEFSLYSGYQTAPHSNVSGNDPENGGAVDFTAGWEGKSFDMPPYYGVRGTWWRSPTFGWGAEFTHAKVYADSATKAASGYDRLELTDGLNILTVNAMRRWPGQWGNVTPYIGGGIGIAVPHVDIQPTQGSHTHEYQLTGPALRWMAGASYEISSSWSAFAEYQGTYSANTIDLDSGGQLKTNIITNAINVGLSFKF